MLSQESWFAHLKDTLHPTKVSDCYHAWQAALAKIEAKINEDNGHKEKGRRLHPYVTLLPSRVPQSIDV